MPGYDFAHVQDDMNPHILRMFDGTFSLDTAHIAMRKEHMCSEWQIVKCKEKKFLTSFSM